MFSNLRDDFVDCRDPSSATIRESLYCVAVNGEEETKGALDEMLKTIDVLQFGRNYLQELEILPLLCLKITKRMTTRFRILYKVRGRHSQWPIL